MPFKIEYLEAASALKSILRAKNDPFYPITGRQFAQNAPLKIEYLEAAPALKSMLRAKNGPFLPHAPLKIEYSGAAPALKKNGGKNWNYAGKLRNPTFGVPLPP